MATSQKQIKVYASLTGDISSIHATTYATARSGATLTANTSEQVVGQAKNYGWGGDNYACFEGFLTFDTSEVPASATIDAPPTLYAAVETNSTDTDFTLRAGVSWTPDLTTADWVAGASLSGKTLCASKSTSGIATNTYYALTSESTFLSAIVKEGTTALLLWSSRHEAGTTPTGAEYLKLHSATSAYPPYLLITYTSEDELADETSLVAPPFTTRPATAEALARKSGTGLIVDWWYEEDSEGLIVARTEIRPVSDADVPRGRWLVVSRHTPGASVDVVWESTDKPDIVRVRYKAYSVAGAKDGTILSFYYPAAPTSVQQRVGVLDLTQNFMTTGAAQAVAATYMASRSSEAMSAKVTAVGGLMTVDDQFVPAPLICAGDWIQVLDEPGPPTWTGPGPVTFVTGISYDDKTATVTITTGGREQTELVVPGLSALPGAMAPYYGIPVQDGGGYYDGGGNYYDGGGGDGTPGGYAYPDMGGELLPPSRPTGSITDPIGTGSNLEFETLPDRTFI